MRGIGKRIVVIIICAHFCFCDNSKYGFVVVGEILLSGDSVLCVFFCFCFCFCFFVCLFVFFSFAKT